MESTKDYIEGIDKAERRYHTGTLTFAEVEENGAKKVDENIIEGYAANFETESQDFGGWVETIDRGFFDDIINDPETYALFNHSMNQVLGRNKVNVKLSIDDNGLRYSIKVPNTTFATDLRTLVKDNIINKSSFAFTVKEERWVKGDPAKGVPHKRHLIKGEKLYDVAVVTRPAYDSTSVGARSMDKAFKKEEGIRQIQESIDAMSAMKIKLRYNISKTRKFNLNKH